MLNLRKSWFIYTLLKDSVLTDFKASNTIPTPLVAKIKKEFKNRYYYGFY